MTRKNQFFPQSIPHPGGTLAEKLEEIAMGLPKAPLNGSTRWIRDTPLIQLTGRYKRNDIFWFTFFHEAGHILKHGKKDIFLEDVEYSDKDLKKESEADEFASHWTLSAEQEKEVIEAAPLNDDMIYNFAEKFNTHPAIIIGRLQHRNLIHPSQGRQFIKKVDFESRRVSRS